MRKISWIAVLGLAILSPALANATGWRKDGNEVQLLNKKKIAGCVHDHTANHGKDNRIWARTLWQRRDLYVYTPPGYQSCHKYPLMIWLHDFHQDERSFLRHIVPALDEAIRCGKLPPMIVAAPDGSFKGEGDLVRAGSFFLNSPQGDYADFVLHDVWDFVCRKYSICCEREGHVIAGVGMGGFAAYNYAIKHREAFGNVIGIMAPLNMRWQGEKGFFHANFNPHNWGWKCKPASTCVGQLRGVGSKAAHLHTWLEKLYGGGEGSIQPVAYENPIEMIDRYCVRPGQLEMYVAYAGNDDYNIDAQTESFLYLAHWRKLNVCVGYDQHGHHTFLTTKRLLPGVFRWLQPRMAPFSPAFCCEMDACECIPCETDCSESGTACESGACAAPARRILGRHRLGARRGDAVGYPHTLPDPAP